MTHPLHLVTLDPQVIKSPLFSSMAMGTSMLPFIQPGIHLVVQRVSPVQICVGDVISYRNGTSTVCHRVLKVIQEEAGRSFLTKGDHRLRWDPLVKEQQVIGKVIKVGSHPTDTPLWRFLNYLIAVVSLAHALVYQTLAHTFLYRSLSRLKYHYLKQRFRFQVIYTWLNPIELAVRWCILRRTWREHRHFRQLLRQGWVIRPYGSSDAERIVVLWNQVFPKHLLTQEIWREKVVQSPFFDPEGCLIAERDDQIAGLLFASERRFPSGERYDPFGGCLEVCFTDPRLRRRGIATVMFNHALSFFHRRGFRSVSVTGVPTEGFEPGNVLYVNDGIVFLSARGFRMDEILTEMRLRRDERRSVLSAVRPVIQPKANRVTVRNLAACDIESLRLFLRGEREDIYRSSQYYLEQGGSREKALVAVKGQQVIGLVRWDLEKDVPHYGEAGLWLFTKESLENSDKTRGFLFSLIVDPSFRGQGVGTLILAEALEGLFRLGCEEAFLLSSIPDFYEPMGFQKTGRQWISMTRDLS